MVEKAVVVRNAKGIHLRPSAMIAQAMRGFGGKAFAILQDGSQEEITVSPFSVMGMALRQGAVIYLRVEGEGATEKLSELAELFEKVYEFN